MAYINPIVIDKDKAGWTGKFYEQCAVGNLFCFGGVSAALVAANATATGLSATAKPVIGVYNPANSGKNLVILQTTILITSVAASTVLPGAFVWVTANSTTISTGSAPISRLVMASPPASVALGFALSTAVTGLSGNLTNTNVPVTVGSVVTAQPSTATSMYGSPWVEDNEGSWIVEPGNFLGIMNTTSTTTVSVAPSIVWAELPVTG